MYLHYSISLTTHTQYFLSWWNCRCHGDVDQIGSSTALERTVAPSPPPHTQAHNGFNEEYDEWIEWGGKNGIVENRNSIQKTLNPKAKWHNNNVYLRKSQHPLLTARCSIIAHETESTHTHTWKKTTMRKMWIVLLPTPRSRPLPLHKWMMETKKIYSARAMTNRPINKHFHVTLHNNREDHDRGYFQGTKESKSISFYD